MVGRGLVAAIFRKQLGRFTQKTKDDALSWRARQLGRTLGVQMPDVFVEDSSRAAAESALDKLTADALPPEAQMTMQISGLAGKSGNSTAQLAAARVMLRRAARQKTAEALQFAPSPRIS